MSFSSLEREQMLQDMTKKPYDVFIIGGGISQKVRLAAQRN